MSPSGPEAEAGIAGLHTSAPQPLPFDRRLAVRAFLLERPAGNVLIYGNDRLGSEAERLRGHGEIERHLLGHWHEAMFERDWALLGAPLAVHDADADEARERVAVTATFDRRHRLGDDLEAIPIPGHTPGSTAYLWRTGGRRLLFTADSVYLRGGRWVAALLGSSDRAMYVASLELLATIEFDVLVPWAAEEDGPYLDAAGPEAGRARLGEIAERLRQGESA